MKKNTTLKYIAKVGVLSAVAAILMLFEIPLWFAPSFYELDLSELPILIGGFALGPIAAVLMGNQTAALFTFVVPFLISTVGGTIMAIVITMTMKKTKVLAKFQQLINS